MSLLLAGTRFLLRFTPRSTDSAESLHAAIAKRGEAEAPIPASVRRRVDVTETTVQGRPVVRLTPRGAASGRHLIYLHGGCYTFGILTVHWNLLATLADRSGVTITVPLYGLAPTYHPAEAYALLDEVYANVVEAAAGRPVFLGGDSAGGGLALGQALRLRDGSVVGGAHGTGGGRHSTEIAPGDAPAPAGLILLSPWLDVTLSAPQIADVAPLDPMLGRAGLVEAGDLWRGDLDGHDPLVSPLYGDLRGLPPIFVHQGDRDILLPDAKQLARTVTRAGGRIELRITKGGFHVFVGAPWTREAKRAIRRIVAELRG
ncbi:alpha/beta hydrolase [Frondihabitans cladoniiphilus]|uniref:Alpha/beta hydrolase n=1 Tax=Frondihabitans cladoniiphilus TaxID=715785 RepID=A0ABP8W8G3_9MICO